MSCHTCYLYELVILILSKYVTKYVACFAHLLMASDCECSVFGQHQLFVYIDIDFCKYKLVVVHI